MRGFRLALAVLTLLPACSKSDWIYGRWAQLSEDGKLTACIEFDRDGSYRTFLERNCEGAPEELLGGKYQLKKNQLIMKGRNPLAPPSALSVVRKDKDIFVASGPSGGAGEYFRVEGPEGVAAVQQKLLAEGKIKIRELTPELGCQSLDKSLDDVRKLPKDEAPRFLRKTDLQLATHAEIVPAGKNYAKITYAADNDRVIWIAWELNDAAFGPDPMRPKIQMVLGPPVKEITIGDGPEAQQITGWQGFCRNVRGQPTVDVDLTLFTTPSQKKGTVYLSDGSVGKLWHTFEELAKEQSK